VELEREEELLSNIRYKSLSTKAIALVDNKIDYILQQRQIVVKVLGNQIDIEDSAYTKYASTSFQSIVWMLRFDIVTIKRNAAVLKRYENNHCITTTKLLRRCI
jgi:hypothetical protein